MKKTTSFFDRINKKLLIGLLCIAAAVLLFSLPGAVLQGIIKVAGALIIAVAVITLWVLPESFFSIFFNDTYGFLRVSHSRNPKNIRNPLIFLRKMATFSCFWGPKVMHFHASMKRMTF